MGENAMNTRMPKWFLPLGASFYFLASYAYAVTPFILEKVQEVNNPSYNPPGILIDIFQFGDNLILPTFILIFILWCVDWPIPWIMKRLGK